MQVSKQRLEELLESEIVHFARALKPHPMTLQQILQLREPESLRDFLLEELPIRFARRLQLIESLPEWNKVPHMRVIRSLYSDAFRRLRMVPPSNPEKFREALRGIKSRNTNMLMHVVRGVRAMKRSSPISDVQVNQFLDEFLTARIGTDILSSQYLAITRVEGRTSVIDPQCDAVGIVRSAASNAQRLCEHHYGWAPPLDVVDVGKVRFPFIGQYLNYIMFELIKNSLRAVVERYGSREEAVKRPVRVVVCGDETTVVLRVSDSGGGIPLDDLSKVWSYLYTTARPAREEFQDDAESDDEGNVAPMAGFGCGLPLSRNYASYVGGRLVLNSMPNYGTDAYLYLNRLGNAQEALMMDSDAGLPSRGFLPRVK